MYTAPLVQFLIQIGRIGVAPAVGVVPVHIIHLYLDEVKMVFPAVVQADELVELRRTAVEREAQVADAARLPLLVQELHHPVLHVALAEGFHAAAADGVQEIVVEVVRLELHKGVLIHFYGRLRSLIVEVGELGGNIILLPGMTAEGNTRRLLALSLQVCGGGVKVIDAMFNGIIHHLVHGLLVNFTPAFGIAYHGPAHAAEAQQGDLVPVVGIGPVDHLSRTFVAHFGPLGTLGSTGGGQGRCAAYLDKVSSFHTCTSFPLTVMALMGLTGHRYSHLPQPMQTSSATTGRLCSPSATIMMAPVGQACAHLPHELFPVASRQRVASTPAVPRWKLVLTSLEMGRMAPAGQSSPQRVHSGRQ